MPIHLPALTRRGFLVRSAAAVTGALTLRHLHAASADAHSFALMSDTHIDADPARVLRDANMADNLRAVVRQITAHAPRVSMVLHDGDVAVTRGLAGDYAQLARLVEPLSAAGLPVHMTLGNHDDREVFAHAVRRPGESPILGRHVTIIETARANWFLLDSLDAVNKTPGRFGEAQLNWLAATLDQHAARPAIVFAHHNLQPDIDTAKSKHGLFDTLAFYDILKTRKHVKAYVFGHSHNWNVTTSADGIALINLPPTAYVFNKDRPNGWVHATLHDDGITLTLHALDPNHPEHGRPKRLTWRA